VTKSDGEIGMLPVGLDAAEAFYRVIDAAYERRSVAVTSNLQSPRTCTLPASPPSCARPWPPPPSIGFSTTPTSSSPKVHPNGSPTPRRHGGHAPGLNPPGDQLSAHPEILMSVDSAVVRQAFVRPLWSCPDSVDT
jgi:hypothetical protein